MGLVCFVIDIAIDGLSLLASGILGVLSLVRSFADSLADLLNSGRHRIWAGFLFLGGMRRCWLCGVLGFGIVIV